MDHNAINAALALPTAMLWAVAISQILLTLTVVIAVRQLKATKHSSHASLLLELDSRWEVASIRNARVLIVDKKRSFTNDLSEEFAHGSTSARIKAVAEKFTTFLDEEYEKDDESKDYTDILSLCGFFETAGLMVEKKFVELDVIMELFYGPILDINEYIVPHLRNRAEHYNQAEGFFEHTLKLCEKAKQMETNHHANP